MDAIDLISEKIEKAALISLHQCCPEQTRKALSLELTEVADGLIASCPGDPSILINRTVGLGTELPVTVETLDAVVSCYTAKHVDNYFLQIYDDTLSPKAQQHLANSHFTQKRGWMKFRLQKMADREIESPLRIEKISGDKADDFGKIVCQAFGMKAVSIPLLSGLANDSRWHLFVSYAGDNPAGAGALFVDDKNGWLEWGATSPEFRCHGSQAAIMHARLKLALEMGCEHIFTETGEAVPGDPQHSYKNILKSGFVASVLRQNYVFTPKLNII